jgi:hypothetical protein
MIPMKSTATANAFARDRSWNSAGHHAEAGKPNHCGRDVTMQRISPTR